MREVWESYKFYVKEMKEDNPQVPDPTLMLEKEDVLHELYYKYASEEGHHPQSYRVLKCLFERHIEGRHLPFHRYFITPLEEEAIEEDGQLPPYCKTVLQNVRRSRCSKMLNKKMKYNSSSYSHK